MTTPQAGEMTRPAYLEFVSKMDGFWFHWDNLHVPYDRFQAQFIPALKTAIGLPPAKWFERHGGGWWSIPTNDMNVYEIDPAEAQRAIVRTIQEYVGERGVMVLSSSDLRDGAQRRG